MPIIFFIMAISNQMVQNMREKFVDSYSNELDRSESERNLRRRICILRSRKNYI
jgi:hypothetical protein